jgi:CubicO group peptidase (beta-lactamase class C family)
MLCLCLAGCAAQVVHAHEIDRRAVEVFFDEAWTNTLRMDGLVPGAVITVVHEGEVILNKGYGVRDIGTGGPVDPENTRLRIGSTSKLFSALTALALVDEADRESFCCRTGDWSGFAFRGFSGLSP